MINIKIYKKIAFVLAALLIMTLLCTVFATAATVKHTVVRGESMWLIAKKYQVGLSEIINANPQVRDPHWIYPNDILNIPLPDQGTRTFEQEVIRLTNQRRAQHGLKPLAEDWELSRVASYKSKDMHDKRYFSHQSPTYGSPFDMMKQFGINYRAAGENIAMGYSSAAAVVEGWMNSPGHRANILNASFTHIGVGYYASGHYWTQMFIGK